MNLYHPKMIIFNSHWRKVWRYQSGDQIYT